MFDWYQAKADRDARTHVYFVEGAGLVKIGFAARATDRFFSMLTSCPIPLSLLASMPGGPTVEHELHKRFEGDRAHGEWFRRSPELDAVIASAPHQYGPEYQSRLASLFRKGGTRPPRPDRFRRPRKTHDRYGNPLPPPTVSV
jgi:hypothetical protein